MKTLPVVLLSVAASVAASSILVFAVRPVSRAAEVASSESSDEVTRLSRSISEELAEMQRAVAELRSELAMSRGGESRLPLGEIDAAVARALEGEAARAGNSPAKDAASPAAPKPFDPEAAFASLQDANLGEDERDALWKKIAEEGGLDQVLALFEARAAERPDDASAQYDLGAACLQKLLSVPDGMEKGVWANKADKAFDKTLALDDHHWEARYSKAIGLSFWPPMFGKQAEAIKHFEVLVAQQAGAPAQGEFVQTHIVLGNLYLQQGQAEKALAAWQNGLAQFPGNATLAQKIASLQSN